MAKRVKKKKAATKPERNFKGRRDESMDTDEVKRSDRTNDVSWYTRSEQSLKDTASLSYSDVLGLPDHIGTPEIRNDLGSGTVNVTVNDDNVSKMPGILSFGWAPSVFSEDGADSPVNVAALNTYSYVRHANAGHANYDHTDLMIVILAIANAFSWLANLIRLYGVLSIFNQKNRYAPRALVKALGFDYDDLVNHINDLRAFINHKISEASILWIPNTMPIVARWFWMNSNVFTDGQSLKAQLYVYKPTNVFKFSNKTSTTGSSLTNLNISNQTMTFDQLVTFTNELMSPLISDEDIGIMCGDMLKAFGTDKIYGMSQIPDEYVILPVYDEEVLMQMHNADIIGWWPGDVKQDLNTDPGFIYQEANSKLLDVYPATAIFACRRYFDLKGDANDPAITMVASRLKVSCGLVPKTDGDYITLLQTGSEVITQVLAFTDPDGARASIHSMYNTSTDSNKLVLLNAASILSKFHWAPFMYGVDCTMANKKLTGMTYYNLVGELENYTTIGTPELDKMHRTAMYSLFGVPYI